MSFCFHSGFAPDITGMMEWKEVLGYTGTCYAKQLVSFDRYCTEKYPDSGVLTWEIAISYLNDLLAKRDVRLDVAALRNLGKYQLMLGKAACVFPNDYFSYKKKRTPYIMNADECFRFFKATDYYPYNKRNPLLTYTVAVFFRLQYATGMRPQEVRLLTRNDFDFVHDTIYIADSKRHKDRSIAVNHQIMQMCSKYDTIARSLYPDTAVFFPSRSQKEHSATSVRNFFRKCWKASGNPEPSEKEYCSPYILRHNFATQTITGWMEKGKNFEEYLPYLSAYMGHATFRETCYYLHLIPGRLSKMGYMDISEIVPEVTYED